MQARRSASNLLLHVLALRDQIHDLEIELEEEERAGALSVAKAAHGTAEEG